MQYPIDELIIKYLSDTLTDEERLYLDEWKSQPANRALFDQLSNSNWIRQELRKMQAIRETQAYDKLSRLYAQQNAPATTGKVHILRNWYWAAAVVLLLACTATWLLLSRSDNKVQPAGLATATPEEDIPPGGNKATLTLANGENIELENTSNGLLTQQGNTEITKPANGEVVYRQGTGNATPDTPLYNTITTPLGGQYLVTLPDGSKAWLNAASSLRFPTAFNEQERVVELTGEAYFEITPRQKGHGRIPFLVKAGPVKIQVLGTHFNVNAYSDEEDIKTTLLEGIVHVISAQSVSSLKPGEQAQVNKQGTLKKTKPALEPITAWRHGIFSFKNAPITAIMRQAQRWYGIEVIYEPGVNKAQVLNGDIPRNVVLSKFLKILEATGSVHFHVKEKTVTVRS